MPATVSSGPDLRQLSSTGWYGAAANAPNTNYAQPWKAYNSAGGAGATALNRGGSLSDAPAFGSLAQMLYNQGRIDPAVMASQLRSVDRGTQAGIDQSNAGLARGGWGNLGLGKALSSAMQGSGENRKAGIRYQDAADAYARQQGNLGLYQQLVGDPRLKYGALGQGQSQFITENNTNRQAAKMALYGNVIGGIAGAAGAASGGKG